MMTASPSALRVYTVLALSTGFLLASCDGSGDGSSPVEPEPDLPPPSVASVAVSIPEVNLEPGESMMASVVVRAADGTELTDRDVAWSITDEKVADVSSAGLVTARSPGVAELVGLVEGVSDAAVLSVAVPYEHEPLELESGAEGDVTFFTEGFDTTQVQVNVRDSHGNPQPGARIHYSEDGRAATLLVQGPNDELDSTVGIFGDLSLVQESASGLSAVVAHDHPAAEPLVITVPALVLVKVGIKVVTAGVFVYSVTDRALEGRKLRERNAVFVDDWSKYSGQCATLEEVASFIHNELEEVRLFRRQLLSVGFLTAGAAVGHYAMELSMMVADETIDHLPSGELTTDDLIAFANEEYGISLADLRPPSGRVAMVIHETEPLPAGATLAGSSAAPPVVYAIDVYDAYCSGLIPADLQVGSVPSVVDAGSSHEIVAQVTSDWGNGVEGVEVEFLADDGHGTLTAPASTTDVDGIASVRWEAPKEEGTYDLTVRVRYDGEDISGSPLQVTLVVEEDGEDSGLQRVFGMFSRTCGATAGGALYCWGAGADGKLGNGAMEDRSEPAAVSTQARFTDAAGGWNHTCAVASDGQIYCWGRGIYLGTDTDQDHATPVAVDSGQSFSEVSAGAGHTCGLTQHGVVYCWGFGDNGRLGNGSTAFRQLPHAIDGEFNFVEISAGFDHTCALEADGSVYCWGGGESGELGTESTADEFTPVRVSFDHTFVSVESGDFHTCGVTTDGTAYCWGYNRFGQLGDGSDVDRSRPVEVASHITFQSITAGAAHTCAVATNGTAYCWGNGSVGALGTGTEESHATPVPVAGDHRFSRLSAGSAHTCGESLSGGLYCWGLGGNGQLGHGSFESKLAPTRVLDP